MRAGGLGGEAMHLALPWSPPDLETNKKKTKETKEQGSSCGYDIDLAEHPEPSEAPEHANPEPSEAPEPAE